ncbi:MAG: very short patch repair endonuclease [Blastocatellia bacterium]
MTDVHTREQRHRNMSAIKGANTKPEMMVRSMAHGLGFRYRLHRKDLPGKPDLVFPSPRKVIFVHGCFWHMHDCRYGSVIPATNTEFWQNKRMSNVTRDQRNLRELKKTGWRVLVIWECETKDLGKLEKRLRKFLTMTPSV